MDQASAFSSGYTAEKETDRKTYNVTDKEPVCMGKRKCECILDSLDWVKKVARDPLNLVSRSLPERSKWKDFGEELPWRQVLLFCQETMVRRNDATSRVEQSIWKKKQAMLPSMYNDVRHSSRRAEPLAEYLWLHKYFCKRIPVGTAHQAEIPEWSGNAYESDTKWLGTRVWPHEISLEN